MAEPAPTSGDSIVYHYTSPTGLLGIIGSPMDRIGGVPDWMLNSGNLVVLNGSDVRYMNDAQELRFAGELVVEKLRDRLDGLGGGKLREIVEKVIDDLDTPGMPFGAAHRVFSVCFCSDGDLLSQWRGYAGSLGGYAIGFRRKTLEWTNVVKMGEWENYPPPVRSSGSFLKVVYDEKQRSDVAEAHAETIVEQARSQLEMEYAIPALFGSMSRFAQYKHPTFDGEQEWRLVFEGVPVTGYSVPVLFRPRTDGLVPYVPFIVGSPAAYSPNPHGLNFKEVISDVVVGPGPDLELRVDAAKSLLHRNGHDPEVVRGSDIPFKG